MTKVFSYGSITLFIAARFLHAVTVSDWGPNGMIIVHLVPTLLALAIATVVALLLSWLTRRDKKLDAGIEMLILWPIKLGIMCFIALISFGGFQLMSSSDAILTSAYNFAADTALLVAGITLLINYARLFQRAPLH